MSLSRVCGVVVVSGVGPLRGRLFRGGCSRVEYQRIGPWRYRPVASTDSFSFRGTRSGTLAGVFCRVVFGTLLGPEATGPVVAAFGLWFRDLCFWFSWLHRARTGRVPFLGGPGVRGVWFGVVV